MVGRSPVRTGADVAGDERDTEQRAREQDRPAGSISKATRAPFRLDTPRRMRSVLALFGHAAPRPRAGDAGTSSGLSLPFGHRSQLIGAFVL
jgi:hypothetical protein